MTVFASFVGSRPNCPILCKDAEAAEEDSPSPAVQLLLVRAEARCACHHFRVVRLGYRRLRSSVRSSASSVILFPHGGRSAGHRGFLRFSSGIVIGYFLARVRTNDHYEINSVFVAIVVVGPATVGVFHRGP